MRAMMHFVEYSQETGQLVYQFPKMEIFLDYFEQEKRKAMPNNSEIMKNTSGQMQNSQLQSS